MEPNERNYVDEIRTIKFGDGSFESIDVEMKVIGIMKAFGTIGFGKKTMVQFSLIIIGMLQKDFNLTDNEILELIKQYSVDDTLKIIERK